MKVNAVDRMDLIRQHGETLLASPDYVERIMGEQIVELANRIERQSVLLAALTAVTDCRDAIAPAGEQP